MRVRIVRVILNLEVVLDDGELLKPFSVKPIEVTPDQIGMIPQGLSEAIAQLQAQLDAQNAQTTAPGDESGAG